jgi:hypothetical protein
MEAVQEIIGNLVIHHAKRCNGVTTY